jgi:hypothetical protein
VPSFEGLTLVSSGVKASSVLRALYRIRDFLPRSTYVHRRNGRGSLKLTFWYCKRVPGNSSPFAYSAKTIAEILAAAANSPSERDTAGELSALPWTARAIVDTEWCIPGLDDIPALSDVLYRSFEETGKREYGRPYWLRRQRVVSMTLRILAGDASLVKQLNRYLEAICDEATWVEPQHAGRPIDLSAASIAVATQAFEFCRVVKLRAGSLPENGRTAPRQAIIRLCA